MDAAAALPDESVAAMVSPTEFRTKPAVGNISPNPVRITNTDAVLPVMDELKQLTLLCAKPHSILLK